MVSLNKLFGPAAAAVLSCLSLSVAWALFASSAIPKVQLKRGKKTTASTAVVFLFGRTIVLKMSSRFQRGH